MRKPLRSYLPTIPWSVKNQARMHIANNIPPYSSAVDAISKFPETATALGVKLDDENNVEINSTPWNKRCCKYGSETNPLFLRITRQDADFRKKD